MGRKHIHKNNIVNDCAAHRMMSVTVVIATTVCMLLLPRVVATATSDIAFSQNETGNNSTCTAFEYPATVLDDIFGVGAPTSECPRLFDCATTYCMCIAGSLALRNNNLACENGTITDVSTVGNCTKQRALCFLLAGLDAATRTSSGPCNEWGERVQLQYARWTVRQPSALTTSCVFGACSTIAQAYPLPNVTETAGNFTVDDVQAMCNFSFAVQMPQDSATPNGTCTPLDRSILLPTLANTSTCPAVASCLLAFCLCHSSSEFCSSPGNLTVAPPSANATQWNLCVPAYFDCVTSVAVTTVANVVNSGTAAAAMSEQCLLWSLESTQDYTIRLYQSLGGSSVSEVIGMEHAKCLSTSCALLTNATTFNATASGRDASCGIFADTVEGPELPFPFPGGVNCPVLPAVTSPLAPLIGLAPLNCSLLDRCTHASFCGCLADNASVVSCDPASYRGLPTDRWTMCSAKVLICLVNLAFNTTVNMTAGGSGCASWAESLKASYGEHYYAAAPRNSTLFSDCAGLACVHLGNYRPLALLASNATDVMCAFANLTIVPARPPCLNYTCPDSTCAIGPQSCACSVNATVLEATVVFPTESTTIQSLGTLEYGTAITAARISALYRVPGGVACSNYDFSSYLTYVWTLTPLVSGTNRSASGVAATIINGTSTSATFASGLLLRNGWYNLSVRIVTFFPTSDVVVVYSFHIVDPTPVASIVIGGVTRRVSSSGFTLDALVQDVFFDATAFSWNCVNISAAVCPTNLTTALATNGTITGVNVGGFIPVGVWNITFSYKAINSTLQLTVVNMVIPIAQILLGGSPVYSTNYFMPTQTISLAAAVSYPGGSGSFTYLWTVNGAAYATTSTARLPAASLLTTSSNVLERATPNVVVLRVTSDTNTNAYGEASAIIYVAQLPSLAILSIANRFTPSRLNATALTDSLSVVIASNVVNATAITFGQPATVQTSYYAVSNGGVLKKTPLYTTTASTNTTLGTITRTILETPLPNTKLSSVAVLFTVELVMNGVVITGANRSFLVVMPAVAGAITSQLSLLATYTDAITAAPTISNLGTLMQLSTNLSTVRSLATTLVTSMTTNIVNGSTVPTDIQGIYLAALGAITSTLTTTVSTALATQLTSMVNIFVREGSFSAVDNGQSALDVLGALPVTLTVTIANTLATRVAESTSPGSTMMFTSGTLTVGVRQETASSFPSAVLRSTTAEMAIPLGFQFPGTTPSSTSYVAIAVTEATSSAVSTSSVSAPLTSSMVNFRVLVNNLDVVIANLVIPLVFNIKSVVPGRAECWYYNTQSGTWLRDGLTVVGVTGDEVTCTTTHLTSFGAFSTGASASAPLLMSVAVALLVLCTHLVAV